MQTDTTALTDRIRQIMADVFDIDESDLQENVSQQDYAPWDSLQQLTLLVALEEGFDLTFSTMEISSMNSLPAIVTVLRKHLAGVQ